MVGGQANPVMRYLRRLAGSPPGGDVGDEELLRRFVLRRDEAAFTSIIEKHGPMVLSVCRRILPNPHDAEDAFQATFLILVRKADSLTRPGRLAAWLYGVAYRTALRAKSAAAQRHCHEMEAMAIQASKPMPAKTDDLTEIIDDEVNRLPIRYRSPVILCYLLGKTNKEAARELGCAPGTIFSRLSRAREMLRNRLIKRGLSLSAAGLATSLADTATQAAVSSQLIEATVQSALSIAAGKFLAGGGISASVFSLTRGVEQAMFMKTLKVTFAIILSIGLTVMAVGGTGVAYLALAHDSSKDEKGPSKQATTSKEQDHDHAIRKEGQKKLGDRKAQEEAAKKKLDAELNINRLLQQEVEAAKLEVDIRTEQNLVGRGTTLFLFEASKRLLTAEEATKKNKEDLAPLQAHFDRMKKIQDLSQGRFDEGKESLENVAQAKFFRLEAEIWLERAKIGEWKLDR